MAVVPSVWKFKVKVMVPPDERVWVDVGVISENVAPVGTPEL